VPPQYRNLFCICHSPGLLLRATHIPRTVAKKKREKNIYHISLEGDVELNRGSELAALLIIEYLLRLSCGRISMRFVRKWSGIRIRRQGKWKGRCLVYLTRWIKETVSKECARARAHEPGSVPIGLVQPDTDSLKRRRSPLLIPFTLTNLHGKYRILN